MISATMKTFLFFLSLFFITSFVKVFAQELQFSAEINPSTVYEGELFELSFSVNTNQWGDFFMPDLDGFQRISGPSRSSQTTVVNGVMHNKTTLSWRFRATTEGKFTIDQGILEMAGETLYSNPVELLVISAKTPSQRADRDILISVELSCDTCYLGQQIIADLYLYTTKSITDYSILSAPDFSGFGSKSLTNLRNFRTIRDTLDNRIYNKHLLRRYLLFPQITGTFEIGEFDLRIVEQDRDSRWGGFFNIGGEIHYLSGKVPPLTIISEPPSAPAEFTSLVGNFQLAGKYQQGELRVGELINMRVVMRGDGDPAQMRIPPIEINGGLSVADVQFESEQTDEIRGKLRFIREWNVLLRADEPGWASAFPYLIAYDIETDSFYRVSGDIMRVEVLPSEEGGMVSAWQGANKNMNGSKGIVNTAWFKYGLPAGLLILAALFFIAFKRRRGAELAKSEADIFREELLRISKRKFVDQKSHYAVVLQALETFLVKLTQLPMSEWNNEVLEKRLIQVFPQKKSEELLEIRKSLINSAYGYYPYEGEELESLLLELISSEHK